MVLDSLRAHRIAVLIFADELLYRKKDGKVGNLMSENEK